MNDNEIFDILKRYRIEILKNTDDIMDLLVSLTNEMQAQYNTYHRMFEMQKDKLEFNHSVSKDNPLILLKSCCDLLQEILPDMKTIKIIILHSENVFSQNSDYVSSGKSLGCDLSLLLSVIYEIKNCQEIISHICNSLGILESKNRQLKSLITNSRKHQRIIYELLQNSNRLRSLTNAYEKELNRLADMFTVTECCCSAPDRPETYDYSSDSDSDSDVIPIPENQFMIGSLSSPDKADDVQFRAAALANIPKNAYSEIRIMMYREEDFEQADREMRNMGKSPKSYSSSIVQIKRRKIVRIVLQSPDLPDFSESEEMIWNGRYAVCSFELFVPENYEKRQIRIRARVYLGLTVLTDLRLILDVESGISQEKDFDKCRLMSAFISYASEDRAQVTARIQGMQVIRPDLDLFFDAISLRSGEHWEQRLYREIMKRDLLYLFWSRHAAVSPWVEKEWRYALEEKGEEFIEPIPIEPPDICPPPKELMGRHFNDWTLRYQQFE